MIDSNFLGILGGLIGLISFIFAMLSRGRSDGEQLARIEVNGLSVMSTVDKLKGEIEKVKDEQAISKTFRKMYEEQIKDLIKFRVEQDKLNSSLARDIQEYKEEIEKLNSKFDRMMEMFNNLIEKYESNQK